VCVCVREREREREREKDFRSTLKLKLWEYQYFYKDLDKTNSKTSRKVTNNDWTRPHLSAPKTNESLANFGQ
jgi:hypothetical protein